MIGKLRRTNKFWRIGLSFTLFAISIIWFYAEFELGGKLSEFPFEPIITFIGGLIALFELRESDEDNNWLQSEQHLENRRNVINVVRTSWVDDVYAKRFAEFVKIELKLQDKPEMLKGGFVTRGKSSRQTIEESIFNLYQKSHQSLLILGAPGSGKTFTLIELCRDLLEIADENRESPIPVIINLSGWTEQNKDEGFESWLIRSIYQLYLLDEKVAFKWLVERQFILLLDGLDEIKEDYREDAVVSINRFHIGRPNIPIVICSRLEEYRDLKNLLGLQSAIEIQPLSLSQVRTILNNDELLQIALQNKSLQNQLKTPLIASIIAISYQFSNKSTLKQELATSKKPIENIMTRFISGRLNDSSRNSKFSRKNSLHWLNFLAKNTFKHSPNSQFEIENLQKSWLSPHLKKRLKIIRFFLIILIGSIFSVIVGLFYSISNNIFSIVLGSEIGSIFGYLLGFTMGVAMSESYFLNFKNEVRLVSNVKFSLNSRRMFKSAFEQIRHGGIQMALATSIFITLSFFLQTGLKLSLTVFIAFLISTIIGVIIATLFAGLVGLFVGTFTHDQSEQVIKPALRIQKSQKLILTGAYIGALIGFLIPISIILIERTFDFTIARSLNDFLLMFVSLPLLGIWFGVIFSGGHELLKHFILRWLLDSENHLPFPYKNKDLVDFLNEMSELHFLQRTGSGYRFLHKTLQEYFASLKDEDMNELITQIERNS